MQHGLELPALPVTVVSLSPAIQRLAQKTMKRVETWAATRACLRAVVPAQPRRRIRMVMRGPVAPRMRSVGEVTREARVSWGEQQELGTRAQPPEDARTA